MVLRVIHDLTGAKGAREVVLHFSSAAAARHCAVPEECRYP